MFNYPLIVTIDTNIFDAKKYDLSKGSTLQMLKKYVDDGIIKVVLSEIVVKESKKHIAKQVKKNLQYCKKIKNWYFTRINWVFGKLCWFGQTIGNSKKQRGSC